MKVLFVSSKNSKLGIAPFIKSQGESLVRSSVNVDYFTIEKKGARGYLQSIKPLREYVKQNNFDLIHAHYALSGWVAVLARTGLPVVVSYMGSDVYGDIDPSGKRTSRINIPLAKLLQPWVKHIIVKSANLEKTVYLKKKVHIIPNGVNFERFKPMDQAQCRSRLDLPQTKKIVLFLGDPTDPRKNIALLKAALKQPEMSDIPDLQLETPFPVKHHQVALYLNAADVFVLTSHMEGSPNVVKEAMACNCPITATDVGDVKEVLKNTAGCFITTFDPGDCATQLKQALTFGKRTQGRETVAHLDETIIAERIIKIYEDIHKT